VGRSRPKDCAHRLCPLLVARSWTPGSRRTRWPRPKMEEQMEGR
jgi:hypothetical protein